MSANIVINVKAITRQATQEIDKLKKSFYQLSSTKGWKDLVTGVGVGVGLNAFNALTGAIRSIPDAIGDSVRAAADFEEAMLNVNSIAKATPSAFADMRKEVLDLTRTLPQTATDLARGLYDISSSGFAGAEGVKVLQAAATAASAGLATTAESAAGITAVLNAYGLKAAEAAKISDVLFKVVDRGVITFPELAANIGKTTALAAPLGVGIEEVGAALAVLTKNGIDADNATTQINAILQSILQPSAEAAKLASELGINFSVQALQAKGLAGVLADVIDKTGGSQEAMATLLGESRAIRGAFVLAKDSGAQFTQELGLMRDASGSTAGALAEQSKGLNYHLKQLNNATERAQIELGEKLTPVLIGVVDALTALIDKKEALVAALIAIGATIATFVVPPLIAAAAAVELTTLGIGLLITGGAAAATSLALWGTSAAVAGENAKTAAENMRPLVGMVNGSATASSGAARAFSQFAQSIANARGIRIAELLDKPETVKTAAQAYAEGVSRIDWTAAITSAKTAGANFAKAFGTGLTSHEGDVKTALETLDKTLDDFGTRQSRLASIRGILSSKKLAEGLKSGHEAVRKAAFEVRAAAEKEANYLTDGMYSIGKAASLALAAGFVSTKAIATIEAAAADLPMGGAVFTKLRTKAAAELDFLRKMAAEYRALVAKPVAGPGVYGGDNGAAAAAADEAKKNAAAIREARTELSGFKALLASVSATFAAGWTPVVLTATQAAQALTSTVSRFSGTLAALKPGVASTLAAVKSAFASMGQAAQTYFDAVHRERLADLAAQNDAIQAGLAAQIAAANGAVNAYRDQLRRIRDARQEENLREQLLNAQGKYSNSADQQIADAERAAREKANIEEEARLKAAITAARTRKDRAAAQQALDNFYAAQNLETLKASREQEKLITSATQGLTDFLADQEADRLQTAADAQVAQLQAEASFQDRLYNQQVESENARYAAQVKAFGDLTTLVSGSLEALNGIWDTKTKATLALLKGFASQFGQAGAALVAAFTSAIGSGGGAAAGASTDWLTTYTKRLADYRAELANLQADKTPSAQQLSRIKELLTAIPKLEDYVSNLSGNRAYGGQVQAGKTFLVGEKGPELLTMGPRPGFVASAAATREVLAPKDASAPKDSGRPVQINLVLDGKKISEVVDRNLFYSYRLAARTTGAV